MIIRNNDDIKKLQEIGAIVANCLAYMKSKTVPGITTRELDKLGADYLARHGAQSAPIVMYSFPGTTCISVNREAAHGIPGDRIIQDGDLVNIDVSAVKNGIYGDTGASFVVGTQNPEYSLLLKSTKKALKRAISEVRAGKLINCIGKTIEKERGQFFVIKNLGSHGVGLSLHEEPRFIQSFYDPTDKRRLEKNMVITIEPFLSTGTTEVENGNDSWTLLNKVGHVSAQFEHTMIIRENEEPLVVTYPTEEY